MQEADFDVYKKEANQQKVYSNVNTVFTAESTNSTSLSDFMKTDMAYKGNSVKKSIQIENNKNQNSVEFSYYITGSQNYSSVTLVFEEENLSEIIYWNGDFEYEN